ncbi:alginate O-acetyltransferase AlgX-related protein [Citrobacter amalonaticus]|uniref:alginate O-acetyltransferase AlgX-related protein n=1 Tax=Citrobacter amalonaticus TaxID=35703 RepID=UPI00339C1457
MKKKIFYFSGIVVALLAILPVYNYANKPDLFKSKSLMEKVKNLYNMDVVESLISSIAFKAGVSVEPNKVLIGKDGWLFLGDSFVKTLTKKIEGVAPHKHDISKVFAVSAEWNDFFRNNGVQEYKIIIGPDKDSVYTDKLPGWDRHNADTILEYLLNSENGVYVNTLSPIMHEKSNSSLPLYYHTDTHWNAYGAGMAFNGLSDFMKKKYPDTRWPDSLNKTHFKTAKGKAGDLAAFLRDKNISEELVYLDDKTFSNMGIKIYDFKTGKLLSEKKMTVIGAPPTPALVVSDNALNNDRVLWLRDSYGTAMSPYMSRTFKEVLQVHPGKVTPELMQIMVKAFKPKYVFVTSVERDALGKFFTSPPVTNE